jgi:hypothetical protein
MDHHTGETLTDIMVMVIMITMAMDMVMDMGMDMVMEVITGQCITDLAVQLKTTGWPVHRHIMAEGISPVRVQEEHTVLIRQAHGEQQVVLQLQVSRPPEVQLQQFVVLTEPAAAEQLTGVQQTGVQQEQLTGVQQEQLQHQDPPIRL